MEFSGIVGVCMALFCRNSVGIPAKFGAMPGFSGNFWDWGWFGAIWGSRKAFAQTDNLGGLAEVSVRLKPSSLC